MNVDQDSQLTGQVIGAAIAVHRALGPGLGEATYESALAVKLASLGIKYETQRSIPLRYKDVVLECGFRLDVLVEGRLPLELKAVQLVLPIHEAQLLTYMRLGAFPLGLLLNFEVALLRNGIRRLVLTKPVPASASCGGKNYDDFDALSGTIFSAAVAVHCALGPGLLRSAYQECFCYELRLRNIAFSINHRVPLLMEDHFIAAAAEIPLLVEGTVPVYCLSVGNLGPLHEATLLSRLRQARLPYGLLINFNAESFAHSVRRLTL